MWPAQVRYEGRLGGGRLSRHRDFAIGPAILPLGDPAPSFPSKGALRLKSAALSALGGRGSADPSLGVRSRSRLSMVNGGGLKEANW